MLLFVYRTATPHIALVGLVPGTQHFRNVERHDTVTANHLISLRIDASLYFANAKLLENRVLDELSGEVFLSHYQAFAALTSGKTDGEAQAPRG